MHLSFYIFQSFFALGTFFGVLQSLRMEGSTYLSEFQNERGSSLPEFWTFMLKLLTHTKKIKNSSLVEKVVENPYTSFLGMYFYLFER